MSNTSSLSYWAYSSSAINRYFPIPLLIFGTFGNALNIIVFTRRTLRKNSCVQCLLATSIVSLFSLYIGMMTRFLNGYGRDYTSYSSILCKVRYLCTYLALYCSSWFITLACFDRFCSSSKSASIRALCNAKIVQRAVLAVTGIGCLIFGETIYCFNNGNSNSVASCYTVSIDCQVVDGLLLMIFYTTLPICLMITFGFLTLKNIRQSRRQTAVARAEREMSASLTPTVPVPVGQTTTNPSSSAKSTKMRKQDLQILTMLLVQVGIIVVFSSPMGIYKFYASLTARTDKSPERKAVENFVAQVCILVTYINNSMMFFIYTLTGRVFRQELFKLAFKCIR